MAVLKIDVEMDDHGATEKAKNLDQAIDRIEQRSSVAALGMQKLSASNLGASSSAKSFTSAISAQSMGLSKLDAMFARAEANAAKMDESVAALSSSARAGMGAVGGFSAGLEELTGVAGIGTTVLSAVAGAAVLVASAIGAGIAVLVDSAKAYFQQSDEMKSAREELEHVSEAWDEFKMTVGEALLSGNGDLIVSTIRLIEDALHGMAFATAAAIKGWRDWGRVLLPGLPTAEEFGAFEAALSGPGKLPTLPGAPSAFQAQTLTGPAGPSELAQFEREQDAMLAAKQRAREAAARQAAREAAAAHDTLWGLGIMPEEMAATMGLGFMPGTPTFNLPPEIPATKGVPFMPGTMLPPETISFFQRTFGSVSALGGNIGQAALHGGAGGVGALLGGDLFKGLFGNITSKLGGAGLSGLIGSTLGSVIPGIGNVLGSMLGPLASKVGGFFKNLFGGNHEGRDMVTQFAQSITGSQDLNKLHEFLSEKLPDDADRFWVALTQGGVNGNPEKAKAVIDEVNAALERQSHMMENISLITEGSNARAQNVSSQEDVNTVAAAGVASFGLQIGQGVSPLEALSSLTPTIEALRQATASTNFELSAAGQHLIALASIVEANRVPFQNLAADQQILKGMMDGNIQDFDLFRTIAADIGVQLQGMIDRGVPTAQVLALAQPQLQMLWEAQQKWHFEVDGTTQSLIDQGVQQGIVGANMQSVQQQLLDATIGIRDAITAIAQQMGALPAAAAGAADGMNRAFSTVRAPDLGPDVTPPEAPEEAPGFASGVSNFGGGWAVVGEQGPELVRLPRGSSVLPNGTTPGGVTVIVQGSVISEADLAIAVSEAVRLNTKGSFQRMHAALGNA